MRPSHLGCSPTGGEFLQTSGESERAEQSVGPGSPKGGPPTLFGAYIKYPGLY